MTSVAIVTIALNAEASIERCLRSGSFADERIVVVDARTSDRTAEVAAGAGGRIFVRAWGGYAAQWNVAMGLASSDWVFILAADEFISAELAHEVSALMERSGLDRDAYYVPRTNKFLGRWLRHGGWGTSNEVRLVRRGRGAMEDRLVHERMVTQGRPGYLHGPVLHEAYDSLEQHVAKMNRYTSLEAEEARNNQTRFVLFPPPSLLAAYGRDLCAVRSLDDLRSATKQHFKNRVLVVWLVPVLPFAKFLEIYVLKFGFLDGWRGFVLATLSSQYLVLKYLKILAAYRLSETPSPRKRQYDTTR